MARSCSRATATTLATLGLFLRASSPAATFQSTCQTWETYRKSRGRCEYSCAVGRADVEGEATRGPITHRSSLTTHRSPLTAHRSPLTTHRSLLTAHYSPLTTHRSPLIAHRSPLTTHRSSLTAHHSPLTAHCSTVLLSHEHTHCHAALPFSSAELQPSRPHPPTSQPCTHCTPSGSKPSLSR